MAASLAPVALNHVESSSKLARGERAVLLSPLLNLETRMVDPQQPAPKSTTGKAFGDMTGGEKVTFLWKAVVMLITGGFVFPNIFVE